MESHGSLQVPNYLRRTVWLCVPSVGSALVIYILVILGPVVVDLRFVADASEIAAIAAWYLLKLSPVTSIIALVTLWRVLTDERCTRGQFIGAGVLVVLAVVASAYPYLPLFFFRA